MFLYLYKIDNNNYYKRKSIMDSIVFTLRQKGLPSEVVYNIIYKQRGVINPIASIINNNRMFPILL